MYHNIEFEIKSDALLISDAHYNPLGRTKLYDVLRNTNASQIIFIGDVFDGLFGGVSYSYEINKRLIKLLNMLSLIKEVIYLEGNHDFKIAHLFPDIKYYPISQQPILVTYKNERTFISHGDIYGGARYRIFSLVLRSDIFLRSYNFVNRYIFRNRLLHKEYKRMMDKNLCTDIENFESIAKERVKRYPKKDVKYIIEGHFHQDKTYEFDGVTYINLPSFACEK